MNLTYHALLSHARSACHLPWSVCHVRRSACHVQGSACHTPQLQSWLMHVAMASQCECEDVINVMQMQ